MIVTSYIFLVMFVIAEIVALLIFGLMLMIFFGGE